ncbi:VOC family protein [Streptomyces sp. NPDC049879]|uniref:VOC family protein n=1 Tax=Streptomyces sp. NPDC049879 TaxID=3365598 RepID=UPI00378B6BFB
MTVNAVTHLNFRGDARAALTFYQSVFGGELTVVTYGDMGDTTDPSLADQMMWGQVVSPGGVGVMAYDVPPELPWERGAHAFYISLRSESADELTALWERLDDGATVLRPLGPEKWTPLYGMLEDKFGVIWVMDVVTAYAPS